ncbi:MAG TPA: universal stress protein [Terriglobales bacterium]|jgi:nucleotide-binding universal stress UspA family protein|nr:universal stress protein [Terriglobales bacterium]
MPTITAPPRVELRNILFATDLDLPAQAAQSCALALARRYGAALFTVNVMPHQPFVESAEPDPEQIKLDAMKKLAAMTGPFVGVRHKELIEQGEVPEVLSRLVDENDIDLIVIGTGARTGVGKFLLGSVAEEVFRTAACPVLTVGPHVTHWEIDGNLRHILFATDFGPESVHALPYALSLAENNKARLTLLHVAPEPGVALPEPEPGAMPVLDPSEVVASGEQQLRALIPQGIQLWHEPEYLVQFGPAAETILRISATDVDLIVLGVKRPALLTKHLGAGIAYKIACDALCPVLSIGSRYHG